MWELLKHLYAQFHTGFDDRFNGSLEDQNTMARTLARRAGVRPWDIYSDSQAYGPNIMLDERFPILGPAARQGEQDTMRNVNRGPLTGQDLDKIMQDIFREQQQGLRSKKSMM